MKIQTLQTIFTNTEIGLKLQESWLEEHGHLLFQTFVLTQHDYILVTPNDKEGRIARTQFKTMDKIENSDTFEKRVYDYIIKHKSERCLIVIFVNKEGRINTYTIEK